MDVAYLLVLWSVRWSLPHCHVSSRTIPVKIFNQSHSDFITSNEFTNLALFLLSTLLISEDLAILSTLILTKYLDGWTQDRDHIAGGPLSVSVAVPYEGVACDADNVNIHSRSLSLLLACRAQDTRERDG